MAPAQTTFCHKVVLTYYNICIKVELCLIEESLTTWKLGLWWEDFGVSFAAILFASSAAGVRLTWLTSLSPNSDSKPRKNRP